MVNYIFSTLVFLCCTFGLDEYGQAAGAAIDNVCAGKKDGNYAHPESCTKFVICSKGQPKELKCEQCSRIKVHRYGPHSPKPAGTQARTGFTVCWTTILNILFGGMQCWYFPGPPPPPPPRPPPPPPPPPATTKATTIKPTTTKRLRQSTTTKNPYITSSSSDSKEPCSFIDGMMVCSGQEPQSTPKSGLVPRIQFNRNAARNYQSNPLWAQYNTTDDGKCTPETMHFSAYAKRCLPEARARCGQKKGPEKKPIADSFCVQTRAKNENYKFYNYPHPYACSKYISCHNDKPLERHCPACTVDKEKCPNGKLLYNVNTGDCGWATETKCVIESGVVKEQISQAVKEPPEELAIGNCHGEGNFASMSHCARGYVSCIGGHSLERRCPRCDKDNQKCPTGRLFFSEKEDACLPANQVPWCKKK